MHYIIIGLAAVFLLSVLLAKRMGHSLKTILQMAAPGAKEALEIAVILLFIGMVTGVWRASGTIITFVYAGIYAIRPSLFLLITFLSTCLLSYALGTSFGVAGTAGVIFMALARSGGVDPVITAGVVLSGVFFGDRGSPVAGTANMVSHLTDTDLIGNVRRMAKTGIVPFCLCLIVYAVLSVQHPLGSLDERVALHFEEVFTVTPVSLIPAAFLLILPLLRVPILWCMTASILAGIVTARLCQNAAWSELIRAMILGYACPDAALGEILNGGGMKSMWDSCVIITLACSTSGIFQRSGMLQPVSRFAVRAAGKIGTFPMMILTSLCASAVFCNQVIAILMCSALFTDIYQSFGRTKEDLALDIENICITVPAFVPWSIICTVPLRLLDTDYRSLGFAVFLYAVPLYNWLIRAKKGYSARA